MLPLTKRQRELITLTQPADDDAQEQQRLVDVATFLLSAATDRCGRLSQTLRACQIDKVELAAQGDPLTLDLWIIIGCLG